MSVLTVVLVVESLGSDEALTGYLNAAAGVGGIVAGALAGVALDRRLDVPLLIGVVVDCEG